MKTALKFSGKHPIKRWMTVSNSTMSLLDSVLAAQTTQQDAAVDVLKKAQDSMKQQGEALVQALEQASVPPAGGQPLLDTYA